MDPAAASLLRALRNCKDCNRMIREYDGVLLMKPGWIKLAWKAHKYKNHKM